jgi:hypothetical protein
MVSRSAALGALAGVLLVVVVWGAVWVWSPLDANGTGRGGAAGALTASPKPSAPANRSDSRGQPRAKAAAPSAASPPLPTPTPLAASPKMSPPAPSPSGPPVPVLATVTYEIAARGDVAVDLEDFAAQVAQFLSDPAGWPSAGIEFERVEADGLITIWLAEDSQVPSFSSICSTGLSCSIGRDIIINETRWVDSAPPGVMDDVPVRQYRLMVVNHEVGHWLGHHNHSSCPGPGQLAPLMMQQSKGLDGCVFNPYPLPEEMTAPDLLG